MTEPVWSEPTPRAAPAVASNTDGTSDLLTLHADADGTGANNGIASIKFMGNSNHAAFIKGGHTISGNTLLTFHTDILMYKTLIHHLLQVVQ